MQDSDRLDSDALNPMPSDLAAQLEAHRNPEGELVSVPSDLARQIEEHKKETKVKPIELQWQDCFFPVWPMSCQIHSLDKSHYDWRVSEQMNSLWKLNCVATALHLGQYQQ